MASPFILERLEAATEIGTAKIGGRIELTDHNGSPFDSEKLKNTHFQLVYFGFTHCPDVCPEELDKISKTIELLRTAFPVLFYFS